MNTGAVVWATGEEFMVAMSSFSISALTRKVVICLARDAPGADQLLVDHQPGGRQDRVFYDLGVVGDFLTLASMPMFATPSWRWLPLSRSFRNRRPRL